MKKFVKTIDVYNVYKIIANAKYQKLDDIDKIKLWKISRQLKPFAVQFEEDRDDAKTNLVSQEIKDKLIKALQYEKQKREGSGELSMSDDEYKAFISEFEKTDKLVKTAISDIANKEIEFDFEPLSEEAFGRLMASNDWTLQQADMLEWIVGVTESK